MSVLPGGVWEPALTSADWPGLPIRYRPACGGRDRAASKASAVVARRILAGITSGRGRPGDRLPLESEMLAAYGVSRDTLREALRLLEQQGFLQIRRGPGGGPFVAPVNAAALMFVLLTHEFTASVLVRAPFQQVMGTVLFDYWANGSYPTVAAIALIMSGVTTLGVAAAMMIGGSDSLSRM